MKPVTKWYRIARDEGKAVLNHIEDGHAEGDNPEPCSTQQAQAWGGIEWLRIHATLADGRVTP